MKNVAIVAVNSTWYWPQLVKILFCFCFTISFRTVPNQLNQRLLLGLLFALDITCGQPQSTDHLIRDLVMLRHSFGFNFSTDLFYFFLTHKNSLAIVLPHTMDFH